MKLARVRIASVGDRESAAWAEGETFTVPADLIARTGWGAGSDVALPPGPLAITAADATRVREQAAFTDVPPASSRLPISYQYVPGWARAIVAGLVGRRQRRRVAEWAAFPGWPLDLSADFVADLAAPPAPVGQGPAPVLLTHDIDSPEGLAHLVRDFLPIEEAAGARSANYIVPCAWPIDEGLVGEIRARGHEVGVHGYDHANRTPFAADDVRRQRLDAARSFAERYDIIGYRAPSLLRTRPLLRDLASRYRYDSSVPTSGGLFPVPNNGCASARPFVLEGILEIPLTLPRDGSLRFLGHSPEEIVRMWSDCADRIARARGVVVLLTHCERRFSGNGAMLGAYARFVEHVARSTDRFVLRTPADLAAEFGRDAV